LPFFIQNLKGKGDGLKASPDARVPEVSSPVRNARIPAGFVGEPSAGTRYGLYSSF
jgi:hypothetical protein